MATNGNDTLLFDGVIQQVTTTLLNPYSGKSYSINGEYNLNIGSYDGLDGTDILVMTGMGDYFSLTDDLGTQILQNVEVLVGAAGNDIINLSHSTITYGNTTILGASGDDVLWGNVGNDMISGGPGGNDIIDGGPGDDTLQGNADSDEITGGAGNDTVLGGDGNDTLEGSSGNDVLDGGTGDNVAVFSGNRADYEFSLDLNNQVIVRDIHIADGDEGTDTLSNIQIARFMDGNFRITLGSEFRVNTATSSNQSFPSITGLSNGGFVVSWASRFQDTNDSYGIYAQRYDASGVAQGEEFLVNTYTANSQNLPSITALNNGGFVVTWVSDGQDGSSNGIYAQRYDADGIPQGSEFLVNTYTINQQHQPSITALNDGGFVVSWTSNHQDGSWGGIYAQRYDADGLALGGEFRANTHTINDQSNSLITALQDGGFVVSWTSASGQDGSGNGIYAQRYDAGGVPQGNEFRVNTYTVNHQQNPSIAALNDGGFIVSWESWSQDGDGEPDIYAQRYDVNGAPLGNEFRVNTTLNWRQDNPTITALKDGGFIVTWSLRDQTDLSNAYYDIYAQRYDTSGAPQGSEFRVNTYQANNQRNASITALDDGGFVVSWESDGQDGSDSGIYAQRYDANGIPFKPIIQVIPIRPLLVGSATAVLDDGTEDRAYTISASTLLEGFSAGGDPLEVRNLSVNRGSVNDNGDGTYTILPRPNYSGDIVLNYEVANAISGEGVSASQYFHLSPVNDAPSFTSVPNDQFVKALDPFSFSQIGNLIYDPDEDDSLTLSATTPGWLNFDPDTWTFSGTPIHTDTGSATVTVTATDLEGQTASTQFIIHVAENPNGISTAVENLVPPVDGGILGDGNGDSVPDSQQDNVASLLALDDNPDSDTWITLDTGIATDVIIRNVQNDPAPSDLPSGIVLPYGVFSFDLENLTPGAIAPMSIYLTGTWMLNPGNPGEWINSDTADVINGYWKQAPADQQWTNIATSIAVVGGKLKIDFNLTDGGWTDQDGIVNGTIIDPGAPGFNAINNVPTGALTGSLNNGTEDIVYTLSAATLLQEFSDADGDTLSVQNLMATSGILQATSADSWNFIPALDYNGPVTLTYQVSDGAGGVVDNVTRTLNLAPVNDAPIGSPAGSLANGEEDKTYTIYQSDLIMGFSDVDGDTLSVTGLSINAGTLNTYNSVTGSWTFTPSKDFNGVVNLNYGITDGKGGIIAGIDRSFILDPVNDVPVPGDDTRSLNEDATLVMSFANLLANDTDTDGAAATIIAIDKTGTAGSVVIDVTSKTITYTADADEFDLLATGNVTADSFKYTLQGSSGETSIANVILNITGINDGNSNLSGTVQSDTLNGTSGEDRIKGNNGNDMLNGLNGADDLYGENGDDILYGGDSIDNLFGGNGNDRLEGGNGNDWLIGEKGDDVLTGDDGADIFLFAKAGGNDIITDFTNGADKIQIASDTGITKYSQLKFTDGVNANGVTYSIVTMGNGGQVTLTGVLATALDTTDFIFPA